MSTAGAIASVVQTASKAVPEVKDKSDNTKNASADAPSSAERYINVISSKVESSKSEIQLVPIYSNEILELKRSRSIAVDDATYFNQDVSRETKRKSCLSLPILQTSNYNNKYRNIHTEEIKQANSISTLKLTNNEETNRNTTKVNRSLSLDITNVTNEKGKINQYLVSFDGFLT